MDTQAKLRQVEARLRAALARQQRASTTEDWLRDQSAIERLQAQIAALESEGKPA